MNKLEQGGQTLLELVVGMGLIAAVITALAITTTYGLRNTQFSKNQALATKLAQENLEKVRTIKSANYGVCLQNELLSNCSSWESIWSISFGTGSRFVIENGCTVSASTEPLCLKYSTDFADLGNGFTGEVILADEASGQKRVTSRVFWTDTTGQHKSDLVTLFSKL